MKNLKVLGINQDADFCNCCGRTGLNKVVWIENESSIVECFGVNCAAKKLGFNKATAAVNTRKLHALKNVQAIAERQRVLETECTFIEIRNNFIPKSITLSTFRLDLNMKDRFKAAVALRIELFPITA